MATGDGSTLEIKIPGLGVPVKFADWVHDRLFGTMELGNGDTVALTYAGGMGLQSVVRFRWNGNGVELIGNTG